MRYGLLLLMANDERVLLGKTPDHQICHRFHLFVAMVSIIQLFTVVIHLD